MVPLAEQPIMHDDCNEDGHDDAIKTPPQNEEKKLIKKIKFVNGKKTIFYVDPEEEEKNQTTSPTQSAKASQEVKKRSSNAASLELPANFKELMRSPSPVRRSRRYSSVLKSPTPASLELSSLDDDPPSPPRGGVDDEDEDFAAFKTPKQSRKSPTATFSNSSSMSGSLTGDESYVVYEDEQYFTPATGTPGKKSPGKHRSRKDKKQQSKNHGMLDSFLSPSSKKKKKSSKSSRSSVVSTEESYYDDGEQSLISSRSGKKKTPKSKRTCRSSSSISSRDLSFDLTAEEHVEFLSPSGKKKKMKKRASTKSSVSSDDTFFSLPLTDEDDDDRRMMIMNGSIILTPSTKKTKQKRRNSKSSVSSMSSNDLSLSLTEEEWEEDLVDDGDLESTVDDAEFLSPSGKKKKKKSSKKSRSNDSPKTPKSKSKRRTSMSSSDMSISLNDGDDENDGPTTPRSMPKRRASISSNDKSVSLNDGYEEDHNSPILTPDKKKKKKPKSPSKKSPKDKVSKPRKSLSEQLENLHVLDMGNDDVGGIDDYSPRSYGRPMGRRSSLNFQDLVSPHGKVNTLSMRSHRTNGDILSPRHKRATRRGSLQNAIPFDDSISIDASFFAQEEKEFTSKMKTSKNKKGLDHAEDDVTSATIRFQKKRIKEIKKKLAEIKDSTEEDIAAMKRDYSAKKKTFKHNTKEAFSKARKDEAKKFQEIRASGQQMIDYMQGENQNLLNQAIELKEDMSVLKKQTKVLEKNKEKLDKDMKSLSAFVVSKMQSKEKKEKAAHNCEHRYIPNYQVELESSMKHLEAEQRVKEKFEDTIRKVAKAVRKRSSDPALTKEILAMIAEGGEEAENVGDRVTEDMDFLVQEFAQ